MKKFSLGLILTFALIGLVAAQTNPQAPGQPYGPQQGQGPYMGTTALPAPVAKSLDGKLAFSGELPILQTKDKAFIIRMPRFYYYAYTDGFKAGDSVHLDGYELATLPGQDKAYFLVTKAVVNGKTYDFTAAYSQGMRRGRMMGGFGSRGIGDGRGMMGGRGW